MRQVSEIGKITEQMLQVTNTSCHDNELVLRLSSFSLSRDLPG